MQGQLEVPEHVAWWVLMVALVRVAGLEQLELLE